MTALEEAARAYADAAARANRAGVKAKAASQVFTETRTGAAREAMGAAWKRADRAMHAEWDARAVLCAAAVAEFGAVTLFDEAAT